MGGIETKLRFFSTWRELGLIFPASKLSSAAQYENVSQLIGQIVSSKMATYYELSTVYGLEDALNLYEILAVDAYNKYVTSESNKNG